jgi:hypothetical protein
VILHQLIQIHIWRGVATLSTKIFIHFNLTFDWHKNVHFERHKGVALKIYDLLSNSISRFLKYLENMCSFTFE